jgi:phospholipid transport system substrate-binding protein
MRRLLRIRPHYRRRATALAAALMLLLCAPGLAQAAGAGNFLTELTDRAVAQLTEPGLAEAERKLRFRGLLNEAFDLPVIGRFVLGRYWRRADAAQRNDFLDAFEDMMLHRFLPLFSEFSSDKFDVGPARAYKSNPDFVSVESKLRQETGEPIHVNWRVRKHGDSYKIVDIVAEGVSIAVTLRSEYVSVLKRNGGDVDALTQFLRELAEGF